ncbi:MAG: isoprenylcysteine carboxylmethyltransferase family protein [Vicinamibacterales bacterium]
MSRIGGWLFRHRTSLPLPVVAILLLVPPERNGPSTWTLLPLAGAIVVTAGELLRLWGVHHIGVISRTRTDRLGPLIDSGPFGLVRNPLYLGNLLIWAGFAASARLLWLLPAVVGGMALAYHAIVRWEERLLESRIGESYRRYTTRVPRWIPRVAAPPATPASNGFTWRETLFSERGTLIAIAAGYGLLAAKALAI